MGIYVPDPSAPATDTAERQTLRKFGANPACGTTAEDVWSGGAGYTGWLTTADNFRIKAGGDAADDAAGAGARSVVLQFLDSTWAVTSEELATAGTGASLSTASTGFRLFRASIGDVGAYGAKNTANITIETDGGIVVGLIVAGIGQTQMSMYTIPAGWTGYVQTITANTGAGKAGTVRMWQRQNADTVAAPFTGARLVETFDELDGALTVTTTALVPFPEKTDIWFTGEAVTGTTPVDVRYDVLLLKN